MNKKINVLSLFDGVSIARQAIVNCGIEIDKYYASEIDKYAIQIAQKNFPDTIQVGSVVDLKGEDFKDIDLLCGGSPCQDLSIAKKNREGLCGARSGLFYEYVRILNEVKPKYFILENVNSMPKEAKQIITEELGVEPIMINASLVSAQNRKRLFWVGKLVGDKYEQVKMELPEDQGILLKDILEESVDEKYYIKPKNIKSQSERFIQWDSSDKGYNSQQDRAYTEIGKSPSIPSCGANCKMNVILNGAKTGLYAVTKNHGEWKEKADGKSTCLDTRYASFPDNHGARTGICCISSNQKHATISEDKSTPLVSAMGMGGGHIPMVSGEQIKIRKLTPIECERLQSLPDNYTEGVSNTQRYKALGNGFNCKVIEHIIKNL